MQKFFYQPVAPFVVTQRFADNAACISKDGRNTVIKCDGLHPPQGYRSLYADGHHGALDLATSHNQAVYNAQSGHVYFVDTNPKSGLDVRIESVIGGRTFHHIYEHLSGYMGKVGDFVPTGAVIGWADATGYAAGDHLHFQVEELLNGEWVKIDPEPLMYPIFAPKMLSVLHSFLETLAFLSDYLADRARRAQRS